MTKRRKQGQIGPAALLALALVLLLALAVRLEFAGGVVFEQGVSLTRQAWQLTQEPSWAVLSGIPDQEKLASVALALSYAALGVNDFSSLLPALLSSLAAVSLVYLLATLWFEHDSGLISAFLWATLPVDVFLAGNLLSASLLTGLKLLALYVFFVARRKHSPPMFLLAGGLLGLGLLNDWKAFLPALLLCMLVIFANPRDFFRGLAALSLLLLPLFLFVPSAVLETLQLYHSALLLLEDMIYLPLAFAALVAASQAIRGNEGLRLVLAWLGVEVLGFVLAAHWIKADPLFAAAGVSVYWLQLLAPIAILLGWQFVGLVGGRTARWTIAGVSVAALLVLFALSPNADQSWFDTLSRIALGMAFVLFWLFALAAGSVSWAKRSLFAGFVLALTIGLLMPIKTYAGSYAFFSENPRQAIEYLKAANPGARLSIAGAALYDRARYLQGFVDHSAEVSLVLFEPSQDIPVPTGNFVLITEDFQEYILGLRPDNWSLVAEFGQPEYQRVLLYLVE